MGRDGDVISTSKKSRNKVENLIGHIIDIDYWSIPHKVNQGNWEQGVIENTLRISLLAYIKNSVNRIKSKVW